MPNSKTYEVLDSPIAKGFAELSSAERPMEYRAIDLRKVKRKRKYRNERKSETLRRRYYGNLKVLVS